MSESSLIIFTKASQMLAEADTIQKAKELKDLALTAADWAKRKGMGEEAIKYATSYALEAERKMGEMLASKPPAPGPGRGNKTRDSESLVLSLKDLGLKVSESKAAQKLALLPKDTFETLKAGKTTRARVQRDIRTEKIRREKQAIKLPVSSEVKIECGDFRELIKKVPANSVDLILTDPPYPKEFLPLWESMAKEAARVLKPSGFFVAYSGQFYLPEIFAFLGKHLTYYWTGFIYFDKGFNNQVFPRFISNKGKPILIYCKPPLKKQSDWFEDVLISPPKPEKESHEWQQALEPFIRLAEIFSKPGGQVLEPFMGSGTTVEACLKTKRNIIAFEIEEKLCQEMTSRLARE